MWGWKCIEGLQSEKANLNYIKHWKSTLIDKMFHYSLKVHYYVTQPILFTEKQLWLITYIDSNFSVKGICITI